MALNLAMIFLVTVFKAQAMQEKIGKLNFTKIKNFCSSKATINIKRVKMQTMEWDKVFTNHLFDMELIPDNHDGMITHLEPEFLKYEVNWA